MYIRKLTRSVTLDYGVAETDTRQGRVRGVLSDGTYVFRGIPYARADRFCAPRPVEKWEGVREAIVYGFVCPEITTVVPHDQYTVPHYFGVQAEDCLNLNVWTGSLDPAAKKPVMVWFHGGGFATGSGVEHYAYDGEELSKYADVVAVTVTHRLNVLGHLDLSEYGEEFRYSGNCGIQDLVAALQWVHDNIASFGGDPDRVMIFGQSGGGGKVVTILQTPAADGLYRCAAMQSGGMRKGPDTTPDTSRLLASYVLEDLGITRGNIRDIQTVRYDRLAEAADRAQKRLSQETGRRAGFGPVADGEYYLGHPFNVGFREEVKDIPLLCGTVFGEFSNNYASPRGVGSKNRWSEAEKLRLLTQEYGDSAPAMIEAFKKAYPDKNIADILFMDRSGRKNALDFASLHADTTRANTYNYVFTLESPFNGGTTPWHNAEIPYVFHNAQYLEPSFIPGVTEKLQDIVSLAWANFARTGDPNGGCVPSWPVFASDKPATMVFDREAKALEAHDAEYLRVSPEQKGFSISALNAANTK